MLEIDNNKEFKILRLNKQEILKIGGYGICDSCNKRLSNDGFMICVLFSCYCEKCYKEWYKVAINHKEDREIEKDVYENQVFMELVSPLNRVVVDYEKTDLIKIAMNTDKGLVIFDKEPSKYSNFKTLKELREYINTIDNFEGVILQNKTTGKVYKLKTDKYIELHKTLAEVLNYKSIFELALTEKLDDVIPTIKHIKEKYDFVNEVVDLIVKKLNVILSTIEHYYLNKEDTKEYVLLLKENNISGIEFNTLMCLHKGKLSLGDETDYVKSLLLERFNTETKVRELLDIKEKL